MLNTGSWKDFKFGDLISSINKGFAYTKEELTFVPTGENSLPFVTRTERNNCSEGFVLRNGLNYEAGNAIVIGDTTATVSYQPSPFVCGDHIVVVRADWLNESRGLFITTLLQKEKYRYCYGRAFIVQSILQTSIKLPTTASGEIAWQWIDDYINSFNLSTPITQNLSIKNKVDSSKWKNFKIGDLFRLEIGKNKSQENLPEGASYLYIGAKKSQNGVMLRCGYDSNLMSNGNCIVFICNGQGSVGYCNYMDRPFIGTSDLVMGYNPNLNKYNGMFLVSVIDLQRPKFSFGRKWKIHLKETIIKLPATEEGSPDWLYMEEYIKSLPYGDCL